MVGNLSPFLCLLWPACWLGGCQLGLRGSPKGSKKGPQNDPKSIRNPPGRPLACPRVSGGTPQVPPRLRTCIFMHIYVCLCIYLQYFVHIYAYLCIFCVYLCMLSLVPCIFMHIVVHVTHIYAYLCISMHIQAYLWMFMYIWCIFVHICALCRYLYIFTDTYSWEDADLLAMKNHAAGLHSTGSWNICKYAQHTFVNKHYRKHRHTFERWTGMTPWHGGGLGAVRLYIYIYIYIYNKE